MKILPDKTYYAEILLWLDNPDPKDFAKRNKAVRAWAINEAWNCQRGIGKGFLTCFDYEKELSKIIEKIDNRKNRCLTDDAADTRKSESE